MTAFSSPAVLRAPARRGLVVAIASGKGGVGKTWLAISLAHALARDGLRALLFDADLGLANVDIQLGLMPEHDLGSVLAGDLPLAHARQRYEDGGFDIIAGRSGSGRLANLGLDRVQGLGDALGVVAADYEMVVLDLGAGVERSVLRLSAAADVGLVVVTDEPTALTDAYAFVKLACRQRAPQELLIVVNMAASQRDGEQTYATLRRACESFLKISPALLGIIRRDGKVRDAIRHQSPLLTRFPGCPAAADVAALARALRARYAGR